MKFGEPVVHSSGNGSVDVARHLLVVARVPDGKAELDRVRGVVPVTREGFHRPIGGLVCQIFVDEFAAVAAVSFTFPIVTLAVAMLGVLVKLTWDAGLIDGTGEGSRKARQKGGEKDGLELHCC